MDTRDRDWAIDLARAIESDDLASRYIAGSLLRWAHMCESLTDLADRALGHAQAPIGSERERIGYMAVAALAQERAGA